MRVTFRIRPMSSLRKKQNSHFTHAAGSAYTKPLTSPSTGSPYIRSWHAEAETSQPGRRLSGLLDLPRPHGTESLHAERWRCRMRPMPEQKPARQSPEDVHPGSDRALGDPGVFHAGRDGGACATHRLQDGLGSLDQVLFSETLGGTAVYLGATDEQIGSTGTR